MLTNPSINDIAAGRLRLRQLIAAINRKGYHPCKNADALAELSEEAWALVEWLRPYELLPQRGLF